MITAGAGNDDIDGGGGWDRLRFGFYSSRFDTHFDVRNLVVDLAAGTATGTWNGKAFSYTLSNIESVVGSPRDDTLRGHDGGNLFYGGAGDDVVNPRDGSNTIMGSAGDDTIVYTDSVTGYQKLAYNLLLRDGGRGLRVTLDAVANRATVEKGTAGTDTIEDIVNPLDSGWTVSGGFELVGTRSDDVFDLTVDEEHGCRSMDEPATILSTSSRRVWSA